MPGIILGIRDIEIKTKYKQSETQSLRSSGPSLDEKTEKKTDNYDGVGWVFC